MRSETHPDSPGTFSVAGKTNSASPHQPPPPPHTPFMCLDEGEGCNEWQGCESSLYSAQQTFFLLKLCAICSHHALTHILKHPTPPVLLTLGSKRGRLMNTESDHVQPERQRKANLPSCLNKMKRWYISDVNINVFFELVLSHHHVLEHAYPTDCLSESFSVSNLIPQLLANTPSSHTHTHT